MSDQVLIDRFFTTAELGVIAELADGLTFGELSAVLGVSRAVAIRVFYGGRVQRRTIRRVRSRLERLAADAARRAA